MLCKYILYNNYIEINTCNTNKIVFDIHENLNVTIWILVNMEYNYKSELIICS